MIYSRIEDVRPLSDGILLVTVEGGQRIVYDCTPLIESDPDFHRLEDPDAFQDVDIVNGYTALSWGGNAELIVDELLANGVSLEEAILDPDLADVLDADEENEVYQDDGMLQYDLDQAYRLENGLSDDLDNEDFSSRNWSDLI